MQKFIHQYTCAAFVNGCDSFLIWESSSREVDTKPLEMNGWRLSYGRWVCSRHPIPEKKV